MLVHAGQGATRSPQLIRIQIIHFTRNEIQVIIAFAVKQICLRLLSDVVAVLVPNFHLV